MSTLKSPVVISRGAICCTNCKCRYDVEFFTDVFPAFCVGCGACLDTLFRSEFSADNTDETDSEEELEAIYDVGVEM